MRHLDQFGFLISKDRKMQCSLFLILTLALIAGSYAGDYDYADVLGKSILFYEAQRTGKLPSGNRVPWRGDTFLNDAGSNGDDLTGGYFDGNNSTKQLFIY